MTALPAAAVGRRIYGGKPGRIFSRHRRGNTVAFLELKLTEFEYPDGGYVLDRGVTGLAFVTDAEVLSALDPFGEPVGVPGIQVVVEVAPTADPPKLRIYAEGGVEVLPDWVGTDLDNVWVGLHGAR